MNPENHPCFNDKARHLYGRVHLPVAPRCNVQCNFCNRKYDCVNESRPGVTSGILSPRQAMDYLEQVLAIKENISVAGIAGPGDAFANPEQSLETLRLVREKYPNMILCVATNGLNLEPYARQLADLKVSHVSVTVNAVDPEIGKKIYSWARPDKRVLRSDQAAEVLLERQLAGIRALKDLGVAVKINTIVLPGVNDDHVEEIAKKMAELKVDILNCIPYYPNEGANFQEIGMGEPDKETIARVRKAAGKHIKQMHHCTRCRADAVGLLGDSPDAKIMEALKTCASKPETPSAPVLDAARPRVAVATMEGVLINQHLGEAFRLHIYEKKAHGGVRMVDNRPTPEPGGGDARWLELAEKLKDCRALLVSGIGKNPREILSKSGIDVLEMEGLVEDAVGRILSGENVNHLMKRKQTKCGSECMGGGMGCG
jgi:nitrogen fixation protein NifB